jgi:hypothetical protein
MKADSFRTAVNAVRFFTFLCTCITLFLLMHSVCKIRKFYEEHKLKEELNTKVLIIHFVAFAGVMVS